MNALEERIARRIRDEGPITFETYMAMVLYEPDLGYYARESTRIGREGDFFTSSHLHRIFGAMLGRQAEEVWDFLGRPGDFVITEMGAGMGYLASDLLEYLRDREIFDSLSYRIVEINPALQERQKELLRPFAAKVSWHRGLGEMGEFRGFFVSNELLDAFPVRMIETEEGTVNEIVVSVEGGRFTELRRPCSSEVREYVETFCPGLPDGFRTEVNLTVRQWIREVAARLLEGLVLTIDYGYPAWEYYHEERSRGTLLCYYGHETNEDPYGHVGVQDLTAHVNFSALKKWGEEAGLQTLGFSSQGAYLISLGLDEVMASLLGDEPDPFEIARIKRLILPQGMGESHKVLAQWKGPAGRPILRGFALRNQSASL